MGVNVRLGSDRTRRGGGMMLLHFRLKGADHVTQIITSEHREPWNKGKLVGQKAPFKLKEIWTNRVRLQLADRLRDLALFNLGIDSKLRANGQCNSK